MTAFSTSTDSFEYGPFVTTFALAVAVFVATALAASRAACAPFANALVKTSSFAVAAAWILIGLTLALCGGGAPRSALLRVASAQLAHYCVEMLALLVTRADDQRVAHHAIGAVFCAAAFRVTPDAYEEYRLFFWGFGVAVQGGSVFTKAVQLRRLLGGAAARRDRVEYALVHANAALNAATYPAELVFVAVGARYPSWLYRGALFAQLAYDAFWLRRLVKSVRRYRREAAARGADEEEKRGSARGGGGGGGGDAPAMRAAEASQWAKQTGDVDMCRWLLDVKEDLTKAKAKAGKTA